MLSGMDQSATKRALRPAAIGLVILACGLYLVANLVLVTTQWEFDDVHAYLGAAERLLAGQPLYVNAADVSDLYLYAPWFAFAWIPFVDLPRQAVEVGWAVVLVAATVLAVAPLIVSPRRTWAGLALALLLGGLLYRTAGWANVQPLLVAALVYLLPTRAGPWALGVAASLKPWPLLGAAVYAWRREWRSAAITVGVALVLWVPILFFSPGSYPLGKRPPNLYDVSLLLAAPALFGAAGVRRRTAS
jgi:hypothetical protein